MALKWTEDFTEMINHCIPTKEITTNPEEPPWLTREPESHSQQSLGKTSPWHTLWIPKTQGSPLNSSSCILTWKLNHNATTGNISFYLVRDGRRQRNTISIHGCIESIWLCLAFWLTSQAWGGSHRRSPTKLDEKLPNRTQSKSSNPRRTIRKRRINSWSSPRINLRTSNVHFLCKWHHKWRKYQYQAIRRWRYHIHLLGRAKRSIRSTGRKSNLPKMLGWQMAIIL